MPPRISRVSTQTPKNLKSRSTGRKPKKAQKRALDAFSIASHENLDRVKIRKNRLGESDLSSHRKRPRNEDEEGESEEDEEPKRRRQMNGEENYEEGSDSEGNTWTMGHVDDDDDSDIDSDEAFGESDEERFEGWVFRGSQKNQGQNGRQSKKPRRIEPDEEDVDMNGDIDLNEDDDADEEEEEEDDDFGEEGIDLATALDQYEESDEGDEKPSKNKKTKKKAIQFDDSDSSGSDDFALDKVPSDHSSSDESDEDDDGQIDQLQNLISSLPADEDGQPKARKVDVHESATPSEFGVLRKVDISSFKPKVTDPEKKKSLKLLQDDVKPSKRKDIARKLDAPLPKRQQDKLDRAAANEKANETLGRWLDTVKQNRRAEHLSFPLKHPDAGESMGESRLMPTTTATPTNDLESTIQSILQQSGLSNGKDDEEQIQKWEQLQTNKMPLEEVAKRRAQLRRERELLFREEVRAKRIKKIKSKAYRRVHRKERERLLQREKDALRADGVDVSEDEREYNDRRRAEERMGAKHRESKWAKGVKQSGRSNWDEDARAGVTEMARRYEELRRRIEGKEVRDEDEERSDFSSDDDDDDDDEEDRDQVMQKQLGLLKQNPFSTDDSKLGSMQFMQRAEAARQARNDEDVERLRRELAGEENNSEDDDENSTRIGRRKYGPGNKSVVAAIQPARNEFEEQPGSDGEAEPNGLTNGTSNTFKQSQPPTTRDNGTQNPYLMKAPKEKSQHKGDDSLWKAQDTIASLQETPKPRSKSKPKANEASDDEIPGQQISAPDADGWQTVSYDQNDEGDEDGLENEGIDLDVVLRNQALTAKGFAGDDVEAEFAAEKTAQVEDEADKTVTTTLPGWGAWAGEGLSARQRQNKGKKTTVHKAGVNPNKRKDAKLDRVIINEKRVKKNSKFLASQLPFPFESREQYERSLRVPTGPEWTTKKSFQDATKPRVLVKQGVIRPMHKPMV